ncbi:MAG: GDP-fucose synthetase [Alphaproteobacteria bacterium]|nr:GDP-fucose synthetase [Alphaproteobacteria bacterium]
MEELKKKIELKNKKIWIAGKTGMVGQAILRQLIKKNYNIKLLDSKTLDLRRQKDVEAWMEKNKPDIVFLAAAKVGGILANDKYPVNFIEDNLLISLNVIRSSYLNKVEKLIYLGSSCIYPTNIKNPITEDLILNGSLEPTNQWYALAKISGMKICEAYRKQFGCNFITLLPSNLYGPGDNFHKQNSHVPAALIDRFHFAKEKQEKTVLVWGSGKPLREFLFVDDMAEACIFLAESYNSNEPINVGTGKEISIKEFAQLIKKTTSYKGKIIFDKTKPDGIYRKLLNVKKINKLGWIAKTTIEIGLKKYYKWYLDNLDKIRR